MATYPPSPALLPQRTETMESDALPFEASRSHASFRPLQTATLQSAQDNGSAGGGIVSSLPSLSTLTRSASIAETALEETALEEHVSRTGSEETSLLAAVPPTQLLSSDEGSIDRSVDQVSPRAIRRLPSNMLHDTLTYDADAQAWEQWHVLRNGRTVGAVSGSASDLSVGGKGQPGSSSHADLTTLVHDAHSELVGAASDSAALADSICPPTLAYEASIGAQRTASTCSVAEEDSAALEDSICPPTLAYEAAIGAQRRASTCSVAEQDDSGQPPLTARVAQAFADAPSLVGSKLGNELGREASGCGLEFLAISSGAVDEEVCDKATQEALADGQFAETQPMPEADQDTAAVQEDTLEEGKDSRSPVEEHDHLTKVAENRDGERALEEDAMKAEADASGNVDDARRGEMTNLTEMGEAVALKEGSECKMQAAEEAECVNKVISSGLAAPALVESQQLACSSPSSRRIIRSTSSVTSPSSTGGADAVRQGLKRKQTLIHDQLEAMAQTIETAHENITERIASASKPQGLAPSLSTPSGARVQPAGLGRSKTTVVRESIGHSLRPPEQGKRVKVRGDGWGGGRGDYTAVITEADTFTFTVIRDGGRRAWQETHVLRENCVVMEG